MASCKAVTTEDTMWGFCPSMAASALFTVLFLITTLFHVGQAIYHRTWYCWVIVVSGILQTATYIFRDLSIKNPAKEIYYELWFVLILVAPIWTNAFVYMVFGRMVWRYKDNRRVLRIKAWHYGTIFVILDIIAFLVQVYGAAQAAGNDVSHDDVMRGLHIYMGGIGFQQFFIFGFCAAVVSLWFAMRRQPGMLESYQPFVLLYVTVAVLLLITVRIIFRLIEYSNGLESTIPQHEGYQYGLDSLPMLIALVMFNVVHPGRVMPAQETKMPSFRQRRQQRRQGVDIEMNPNFSMFAK